jgi:hypothetical protein
MHVSVPGLKDQVEFSTTGLTPDQSSRKKELILIFYTLYGVDFGKFELASYFKLTKLEALHKLPDTSSWEEKEEMIMYLEFVIKQMHLYVVHHDDEVDDSDDDSEFHLMGLSEKLKMEKW